MSTNGLNTYFVIVSVPFTDFTVAVRGYSPAHAMKECLVPGNTWINGTNNDNDIEVGEITGVRLYGDKE